MAVLVYAFTSLKTELAKGLRYMGPLPLLQTNGANWDYCGADDMVMHLAPDIQELVRNKGVSSDKKTHRVFGAGCAWTGEVALSAGAACIHQRDSGHWPKAHVVVPSHLGERTIT